MLFRSLLSSIWTASRSSCRKVTIIKPLLSIRFFRYKLQEEQMTTQNLHEELQFDYFSQNYYQFQEDFYQFSNLPQPLMVMEDDILRHIWPTARSLISNFPRPKAWTRKTITSTLPSAVQTKQTDYAFTTIKAKQKI